MGYDVQKFVEVVDANLICGICGLVFEDPVLTPCGHSFCLLCLETWIETSQYRNQNRQHYQGALPSAGSCPECREAVLPNEAKSELSLRNLINGFYMYCEYKDRGCLATVKLERAKDHASRCPHSPVICAGCDESVRLVDLPNHQIHCRGIAEAINSDDSEEFRNERGSRYAMFDGLGPGRRKSQKCVDLTDLLRQMEKQMDSLKRDLWLADVNNAIIESEYLLHKSEMKRKEKILLSRNTNRKSTTEPESTSSQNQSTVNRVELNPQTNTNTNSAIDSRPMSFRNQPPVSRAEQNSPTNTSRAGLNWFEYPCDHGRVPPHPISTIPASRLASFIFQFLFNKPDYIDSRMVFGAIQRCYDHFVSGSILYDHNVHVLIAIAIASDWFTTTQHQNFSQWMQSLAKCRELLDSSSLT